MLMASALYLQHWLIHSGSQKLRRDLSPIKLPSTRVGSWASLNALQIYIYYLHRYLSVNQFTSAQQHVWNLPNNLCSAHGPRRKWLAIAKSKWHCKPFSCCSDVLQTILTIDSQKSLSLVNFLILRGYPVPIKLSHYLFITYDSSFIHFVISLSLVLSLKTASLYTHDSSLVYVAKNQTYFTLSSLCLICATYRRVMNRSCKQVMDLAWCKSDVGWLWSLNVFLEGV